MGSLELFENVVLSGSCVLVFFQGKIICGCGKSFKGLLLLQKHVEANHLVKEENGAAGQRLDQLFKKEFVFLCEEAIQNDESVKIESIQNDESVKIVLPPNLLCICLNEHDIGSFSGTVKCHLCSEDCDNLELLNKHVSEIHKVCQVLVGQNILFERPIVKSCIKYDRSFAFFCPMLNCKYHISESLQENYFKTFKLLKQHYVKVHAAKTQICDTCGQKFGSSTYLELHKKACGKTFQCLDCELSFPALESLQTHARRKSHSIETSNQSKKKATPKRDPLHCPRKLPTLAPRPSALHLQAAIALSELGERRNAPRADIGIQTDVPLPTSRQTRTSSSSPAKSRWKVSAETQTRDRGGKRRHNTVSSQVQTMGEFTMRAKRPREDNTATPLSSQGSQCRLSPFKVARLEDKVTQSTMATPHLSFSLSVDIPDLEALWPLRNLTSGTQTSPRLPPVSHTNLCIDSDEELDVEHNQVDDQRAPLLSEANRQFSTETQTELNLFLDSIAYTDDNLGVLPNTSSETSSMETQTGSEDQDDFLLFANNWTQTELERLFSPPPSSSLSSETQTALTGFQECKSNLVLQSVLNAEDMYNNIETQTCDLQDLLT